MPILAYLPINFSSKYEHQVRATLLGIKVYLVIARGHAHQVPQ